MRRFDLCLFNLWSRLVAREINGCASGWSRLAAEVLRRYILFRGYYRMRGGCLVYTGIRLW